MCGGEAGGCELGSRAAVAGGLGDGGVDEGLGFGLDLFEVVGAVEGFGVDLVDVFGAGGAGGEPAVFGGDFEAADGGVVAGGFGEDGGDGFAGEGLWR